MEIEREEQIDPRDETLVETCRLCRRPKSAFEPVDADLPVCRGCALGVLPRLIAQAVLADSDTGYPLHDAMEASAVLRRSYCFAALYYSFYYDRLYSASRFGNGDDDDPYGWRGPDDEDDDYDDYFGEEVGPPAAREGARDEPGGVTVPPRGGE